MSRYYGGWAPYVPVAERRRKAALAMQKLTKKGTVVSPVTLEGKKIAATFWGKAWCDNLESYRDYDNRLPRGRTYVRNGSVVDLQIGPNEVTAMVSGSEIYRVRISIGEVVKAHWKSICADCAGGIDSLVELLQGRLSKGVMERICRQGTGLFPKPSEIRFSCSCPDSASMCKHVAATLYGVGSRLDLKPELLFLLRSVNEKDLVADIGAALPLSKGGPAAGKVLETDDMAALFGLDMGGDDAPEAVDGGAAKAVPAQQRRDVARKPEPSAEAVRKSRARKAGSSSGPVARAKTAAVSARETAAPVTRVEAVVRQPAGRRPKTAVAVHVLQNSAAKTASPRKKARFREQEPVQWWIEGGGGRAS
nr:hypothetical protein [uncultured Rhodopila sp.]